MDYIEAELEARIFPSVDLDPRDWEEEDLYIMPGDRDDDCDEEPDDDSSWADANALSSAGFGTDEDYGGTDIDW